MEFNKFNFHPDIAAGVKAAGYAALTPIQEQAIPPALEGRDVMGLAQTGTGKTAAFVLPILERLIKRPRGRIRALIIAPTRELADQINKTIAGLGRQTRIRSTTIFGGVGMNPQIQKLRAGVEIVVACPGRLLDHVRQGTINLSELEALVLDEADRMFDMGFLPDIRKIIKHAPSKRQTLLFSATMPDDIRKLAHEVMHNPVTVQVNLSAPANTVTHALYPVEQHLKTSLLLALLKHTDTESVLIFLAPSTAPSAWASSWRRPATRHHLCRETFRRTGGRPHSTGSGAARIGSLLQPTLRLAASMSRSFRTSSTMIFRTLLTRTRTVSAARAALQKPEMPSRSLPAKTRTRFGALSAF